MMRALGLGIALLSSAAVAQPITAVQSFDTRPDPKILDNAEDFVTLCRNDLTDGSKCSYYLQGVVQTFQVARDAETKIRGNRFFCPEAAATTLDALKATIAYMELHPALKNESAPYAVVLALEERFPCATASAPREKTEAELAAEINAFKADPTHPYFDELRPTMAALLRSGRASTLQQAYDLALAARGSQRR